MWCEGGRKDEEWKEMWGRKKWENDGDSWNMIEVEWKWSEETEENLRETEDERRKKEERKRKRRKMKKERRKRKKEVWNYNFNWTFPFLNFVPTLFLPVISLWMMKFSVTVWVAVMVPSTIGNKEVRLLLSVTEYVLVSTMGGGLLDWKLRSLVLAAEEERTSTSEGSIVRSTVVVNVTVSMYGSSPSWNKWVISLMYVCVSVTTFCGLIFPPASGKRFGSNDRWSLTSPSKRGGL